MGRSLIVAVDFDGTCVKHRYPEVGERVFGAVTVLRMVVDRGHRLILLTMRSGEHLADAASWFEDRDLPLWAVNDNPQQIEWTESRKVYANVYIDDAALGCPLIEPRDERPFVDWMLVHSRLMSMGVV